MTLEVTNNRDVEATLSSFTRITARRKNGDWVYVYANNSVQAKRVRTLLFKLARKFKELTMLDIANLVEEVVQEEAAEFQKLRQNAERNADLLKLPLPVAELLSIWRSQIEDLRYFTTLAICGPERRAQIEAELAEREAAMARLLAKMGRSNA
jgi:predicted house-cleaning noncanonical NTP pyrophosphatase (MazG superfamily)